MSEREDVDRVLKLLAPHVAEETDTGTTTRRLLLLARELVRLADDTRAVTEAEARDELVRARWRTRNAKAADWLEKAANMAERQSDYPSEDEPSAGAWRWLAQNIRKILAEGLEP